MTTLRQHVRRRKALAKSELFNYNRSPKLDGCPQKRAILVKVYQTVPKKPNSSNRKIVKARIPGNRKYFRAAVSGQGHNLAEHATVLFKANRVRDIPGVHYRLIRGPQDFLAVEKFKRRNARSKYGIRLERELKLKVSDKMIAKFGAETVAAEIKRIKARG